MGARDNQHVEAFREALDGWTDQRFATREEIEALCMFNLYLVNLAEADGWVYDGHSLNVGSPMCRLVVRGTHDGIPHVVFTSGRTPTACVRIFLRKLDEGWLEWSVDRFRQ